jgi:hypothetical protein
LLLGREKLENTVGDLIELMIGCGIAGLIVSLTV